MTGYGTNLGGFMIRLFILVLACVLCGCTNADDQQSDTSSNNSNINTEIFDIDLSQPFELKFGFFPSLEMSTMVIIHSDGLINIFRPAKNSSKMEAATYKLTNDELLAIKNCMNSSGLMVLKEYYTKHIWDGARSVLWISQGTKQKLTICDNNYPQPFLIFIDQLTQFVNPDESRVIQWSPASMHEANRIEKEMLKLAGM